MAKEDEKDDAIRRLYQEAMKTGMSSGAVSDGRIFVFSVDCLHQLIEAALNKNSGIVTVFIQNPVPASMVN